MGLKNLNSKFIHPLFYLLPLVLEKHNNLTTFLTSNLEGIYIKDTNKPNWENVIILVYKDIIPPKVKDQIDNNENFYEKYTELKDNRFYKIIAFKVPHKFIREFNLLLTNQYTRLQFGTIQHITSFLGIHCSESFKGMCTGTYPSTKRNYIDKDFLILNLNEVPTKEGDTKVSPLLFLLYYKNIG